MTAVKVVFLLIFCTVKQPSQLVIVVGPPDVLPPDGRVDAVRGDPAPERHQVVGVPRLEGRVLEHPVFVTWKTQDQTRDSSLSRQPDAFTVAFRGIREERQQVQLGRGRGVASRGVRWAAAQWLGTC